MRKKLGLVCLVALLLIFMAACSEGEEKEPGKVDAFVMSQTFVKTLLKSPSTAKFPLITSAEIIPYGNGRFKITSYVDAQNSFGAMIRNNYTCTVKYVGDNKWECENIKLE